MPDQVITSLYDQMIFVENVNVENNVVFHLIGWNQTSLHQFILPKVINPYLSQRIPNYKETTLTNSRSSRIHLFRRTRIVINQDLFGYLTHFLFNSALPQPDIPIKATCQDIKSILQGLVNQRNWINCSRMHTVCHHEFLTLILINKLSSMLWEGHHPNYMVRTSCYYQFFIWSALNIVNYPSMTSQAHYMLSVSQIKYLQERCFSTWTSCYQIISNKLQSKTTQTFWLLLVYQLFRNLTYFSVSEKLKELLSSFMLFLRMDIHIFTYISIQKFSIFLFLFK